MERFTAIIHQFKENAEKTGWTYIEIPADIAGKLHPENKKTFRVKGKLDKHPIAGVALFPRGDGSFMMPLNADMRKGTAKKKGGMLVVQLSLDTAPVAMPPGFADCLADEPGAKLFFEGLKPSHRNYFIKWIGGVKGEAAVAKRIAQVITALVKKQDFVSMLHEHKADREKNR